VERKREFPDWEKRYNDGAVEEMPWFYPDLDPDFDGALEQLGIESGRALDLGTGPGTQATALARRGFQVTGTDISATAVRKAVKRGASEGVAVTFLHDDFLKGGLEGPFDIIFDRGCFHAFPPEQREEYVRRSAALLVPRGLLFLKCFSHKETMEEGPYRFTPGQIEALFGKDYRVCSIVETLFQGTLDPYPKALFSVLERR